MRNPLLIGVAVLLVIGFALYMTTYTVRFTDTAVIATFGRVSDDGVVNAEQGEEGIRFRWPAPVQSVTVYDRRPRLLQTTPETTQTADNRQVVVSAFLAWRVSDPLRFYRQFNRGGSEVQSHYLRAEEAIRPLLRSALTEIAKFEVNELFTSADGGSQLDDLEDQILARLRSSAGEGSQGSLEDYGISIETLGLSQMVFPEETTSQVFEAMRAERQRIAEAARSEGEATGQAIEQRAEAQARSISEFAQFAAERIRSRGDQEATQWIVRLQENQELAEFLAVLDFVRQGFGKRTTLILPTNGALEIFEPGSLDETTQRILDADRPGFSDDRQGAAADDLDLENVRIARPEEGSGERGGTR